MGASEITGLRRGKQRSPGHEGSRPVRLPGRSILVVWTLSIALHVGGLALTLLIVFPYAPKPEAPRSTVRAELVGRIDAASFFPTRTPDVPAPPQAAEAPEMRFVPTKFEELTELVSSHKPELSIIGIGAGGGDFSQYGLTAGAADGPVFFGLGRSARGVRRIVYVVDRSGSMLDTFALVRQELQRSIGELRRSRKFHVIFFNSGPPLENPPARLVSAIQAQKTRFFKFLQSIRPDGGTNPEPAMRRALALDPDLIYFLSDGEFSDALVDKLNNWNPERTVRIFTIAYFNPYSDGAALLEQIAREHGGKFRVVEEEDLP
ncbi:MAG: VWA domain-containing protein [Phycisphaerae bacterium]